jgi:hypothetical protein
MFTNKNFKTILGLALVLSLMASCGGRRDRCPSVYKSKADKTIITA